MKMKLLITFLFLVLVSTGQVSRPGEYINLKASSNDTFDTTVLRLNCGYTFTLKNKVDSAAGKWEVKSSKKVILHIDTVSFESKTYYTKTQLKLRAGKGGLFYKTMSRRKFNRLTKKIEKNTGEGQSGFKESYNATVTYRQIAQFDCK